MQGACSRRGLACVAHQTHASPTVLCDADTVQRLQGAVHAAEVVCDGQRLLMGAQCMIWCSVSLNPWSCLNRLALHCSRQHSAATHVTRCTSPPPAPLVPACEDSCPAAADVPMLTSGAGHDALAMAALTRVGMVFVRCRGGVSHSPLEHVEEADVGVAASVLFAYIRGALIAAGPTGH